MTEGTVRVLLIDDDDTARIVMSSILEGAGMRVHAIASPIGATRLVRELEIDVIVCDLNMPAMQGDAFARLFRSSKSLRSVKLILTSGAPREDLERLVFEGAVDGIVHKSDLQALLVARVRHVAGRR